MNKQELEWALYLTGKIKEKELGKANRKRLAAMRKEIQLKPFGSGIVLGPEPEE